MPVINLRLAGLLVAFLLGGAAPALAQSCSFTMTDMVFPNISDASGSGVTGSATLTANCSGSRYSTVMICPNIGGGGGGETSSGGRYMANGTNKLEYQLYSDSARSVIWGSNIWPYAPLPPKLTVTLGLFGSGSKSWPVYGRVMSGQIVPEGTYLSAFSSGHVSFRTQYNSSYGCGKPSQGSVSASQPDFTVRAVVERACSVSAVDMDFGTKGVLDGAADATGQVRVTCSQSTPYEIGLVVPSGETAAARTMSKGSETVQYGLYKDAGRTAPWGDAGSQLMTGTGSGTQQALTVYGRVPPQTTPSAGVYTDTVVVNVTY